MTLYVRPRTEAREAWQWNGQADWSAWVSACCVREGSALRLKRRSGTQLVYLGEWLVRDLDGEPEWYRDCEMRRDFDLNGG